MSVCKINVNSNNNGDNDHRTRSIEDLFRTLTNDSKPRVQRGEIVSSIETNFFWDGRKQVLRYNNREDWEFRDG